jgi:prephenate dehydratase
LKKAMIHLSSSTAEAVKQVALSMPGKPKTKEKHVYAAIGTKAAAKLYGMDVLASNINDFKDNQTRFIVLAKNDHPVTGKDKTSIVFTIAKDQPGGLYNILGEFAVRRINLTKIESRPSKTALGDYYFFADMEGHHKQKPVEEALAEVKKKAAFLKILGSYPRAK